MEEVFNLAMAAPSNNMLLSIIVHIIVFALQLINICDVREIWLKKYGTERTRLTIMNTRKPYLSLSRKQEAEIAGKKAFFPIIIIGFSLLIMTWFGVGIKHMMALHLLFMTFRLIYIIQVIFDNGYVFFYETDGDVRAIRSSTLLFEEKRRELGMNVQYRKIGIFHVTNEELLARHYKK
jgi:hypothetical protein